MPTVLEIPIELLWMLLGALQSMLSWLELPSLEREKIGTYLMSKSQNVNTCSKGVCLRASETYKRGSNVFEEAFHKTADFN